ncbi:TM2 domain-containing membrane protein YozV [Trueperella bonasi]|uniref:TM2 domain-containing membrane protein YozV n=1 Tax=Trueperella bonasi TaxID=312286 RepID=A0ABT9NH29_9ACTO|nr:TM2 domain-containing protein [Trueperella bonasi]MDP9806711.1 TM2 domain-containing membrane protein YozV [Trueperella bonasi]
MSAFEPNPQVSGYDTPAVLPPVNQQAQSAGHYGNQYNPNYDPRYKVMNKHLFVWLGAWFAGAFGVDRFMRGQVGMGLFKLLIGSWITLGIWPLVDWIIAMVKAYGQAYGHGDDIVFAANGAYIR